jgi:hypothetical protein
MGDEMNDKFAAAMRRANATKNERVIAAMERAIAARDEKLVVAIDKKVIAAMWRALGAKGGILGNMAGGSPSPSIPTEPWLQVPEFTPDWRPPQPPQPSKRKRGRPRLPLAEIARDEHGRYGLRRRANLLEPEDSINFESLSGSETAPKGADKNPRRGGVMLIGARKSDYFQSRHSARVPAGKAVFFGAKGCRMIDHVESDDVPPEPIRCWMYGDGFASVDGDLQMSAFGPGALQTIAKKLLAVGYDPEQQLDICRGGKREALLPLREAAQLTEGDGN